LKSYRRLKRVEAALRNLKSLATNAMEMPWRRVGALVLTNVNHLTPRVGVIVGVVEGLAVVTVMFAGGEQKNFLWFEVYEASEADENSSLIPCTVSSG
jgi:hypothetical protein